MAKFDTEVRLNREMTLADATLIGVGAMIGAGIFVLTGIAAGVAGPALIVAFCLNGVIALLTAMSYAELGSCFHDAGGGYLWVKEGLPRWNGFLSGWMSWFAHAVACSLYALGFGAYLDHVLREFGWALPEWGFLSPQKILAAGIAVLFGYVNFRGASETGKIGNMVTIAKLIILAIFIGFGIEMMLRKDDIGAAFTPFFANGGAGVIKAMGLTFIAFQGFEVISQCSEEVRNPRRNIPRAVFLSLAIVVPIYLLVAVVSLSAVVPEPGQTPWDYLASHKETALVEVSKTFFAGGGIMLLVGGIISTMSALNATIYSSSRVAFAMGRDRNFPSAFGKVHKKKFTPHWAIAVSLLIVVTMALSLPIEDVASAADIMFLLLFLQVNIAMIRLRKLRPELDRGFVTPLFPYLSIAGIALLLFLAVYMFAFSPVAWAATAAWIALGLVVYRLYASRREVAHVRKVRSLDRIERGEYRILLSVSNPGSIGGLARIATALAKKNAAEVVLLHVVEVPPGQPLETGMDEREKAEVLLEGAADLLRAAGVAVRPMVRLARRISEGIVQTAEEEACNFVILGRERHGGFFARFFSAVIDSVIRESPCEVAVLHGMESLDKVRRILIPFGRDAHTRLALELAPSFAEHFQAEVRIAVVLEPGVPAKVAAEQEQEIRKVAAELALTARIDVVRGDDVAVSIAELSRGVDLVLMAGMTGDFLELLLGQSLTRQITEAVACPVLWLKEYEEPRSLLATLFHADPSGEGGHDG